MTLALALEHGHAHLFGWTGWQSLVPALLHTLWIGALAAGALGAFLRTAPPACARLRYAATLLALAAVLMGGVAAWAVQDRLRARDEAGRAAAQSDTDGAQTDDRTPTDTDGAPADSPRARTRTTVAGSDTAAARTAASAATARTDTDQAGTALTRIVGQEAAPWRAWGGVAWLAGALLMLARTALLAAGARRWSAGARADAALQRVADELGRALGVAARVTVVLAERVASPVVLGVLRPTILWPLAWATGLPEAQVRAILAHELAHIARHDYLANLVQMFVESLLFFNPTVWWIGRQARQERETCCDARVAEVLGEGVTLARALADAADGRVAQAFQPVQDEADGRVARAFQPAQDRQAGKPAPRSALAFAGAPGRGGLLDRVRRLVEPGYRPAARIPVRTLTLVLVLSCTILAVLKEGGDRVVRAAMPDTARAAKTVTLRPESPEQGRLSADPDAKVTVHMIVETEDGLPITAGGEGEVRIEIQNDRETSFKGGRIRSRAIADVGIADPLASSQQSLSYEVKAGTISCIVAAPGYAPTFAGPFEPAADKTVDAGKIVLRRFYNVTLRAHGPDGRPVAGATVRSRSMFANSKVIEGDQTLVTDADGVAQLQAGQCTLTIEAIAHGYQPDRRTVTPAPGQTIECALARSTPLRGRVVAAGATPETPVAEAEILVILERAGEEYAMGPSLDPNNPLGIADKAGRFTRGTADKAGRFALDTLANNGTYSLLFRAPGFGRVILTDVTPSSGTLTIALPPPLLVLGKCIGVRPEDCESDGRLKIAVEQNVRYSSEGFSEGFSLEPLLVAVQGGVAEFETPDLLPGTTALGVAGVYRKVHLEKAPLTGVVLDLPALRAKSGEPKQPVAKGELVAAARPLGTEEAGTVVPKFVDDDLGSQEPPEFVKVTMAVKTEDGQPIRRDQVWCELFSSSPAKRASTGLEIVNDRPGKEAPAQDVVITSATFGARGPVVCAVSAPGYVPTFMGPLEPELGPSKVDSRTNHSQATGTLDFGMIVLRRGFEATLHVLDENGKSVEGARVRYRFSHAGLTTDYQALTTDASGKVRFATAHQGVEICVGAKGHCTEWRTAEPVEGQTIEVQLKTPATKQAGRVVDAETQQPIAGAEVTLQYEEMGENNLRYDSNSPWPLATTDSAGRFTLDTLSASGKYLLLFRAPGHAPAILQKFSPTSTEMLVALPPPVRGKVIGIQPEDLEPDGRIGIEVSQSITSGKNGGRFFDHSPSKLTLPVHDGVAEFETTDLWPGGADFTVGKLRKRMKLKADPVPDLVLDLSALRSAAEPNVQATDAPAKGR